MIFDSHVHFGQYFDDYYTPPRILRTLKLAGIRHFAYSSTSAVVCDDPAFLKEERTAMHELSNGRAHALLWVTHSMLENSKDLSLYLDKRICGFKVHGVSEKWEPFGKALQRVFCIAQERKIPILLHTGEYDQCFAGAYQKICESFINVPVILAHGRPLDQTIFMLKNCPNAFVDTAFMPLMHLKILIELGFSNRILFGTDTPIPGRHLKSSLPRHLRSRIHSSKKIAGENWRQIAWENAVKVFLEK
ncbi:MAG: amidohydrolase family protein [Hallerella sp.]|uniref:amidohydrolase family protein n=1 Tax=Hallerella sp. TaxID=2815812 RepID=UPI0015674166|nr:amidohydrolase family protein [Hallerella sp.]MCI5600499.1 amidohydrolase family protein [Hallerella sp.]